MNIIETLNMAVATLVLNKQRSSLTMLGIIIGSASVIAIVGIGQAGQKLALKQLKSLGPNVLFVSPGSKETRNMSFEEPKTLVVEDAEAIAAQVPAVAKVAPQINLRELMTHRGRNANQLVFGVTPEFLSVRSYEIAEGRFVSDLDLKRNSRVVILGSELATRLFGSQNPLGKQIRIRQESFQVIGLMETKGTFLNTNQDDVAYIPITTMANQLVGKTSPYGTEVTFISVSAKDQNSIKAAQFQIENLLRLRHKITREDDFNVETQKDILQIVDQITTGLILMLSLIAGISLLVGGIGIMNIMLVSIAERTQEIGLRKAIGASERDILEQFLIEALILAIAGGCVGIVLGGGVILVIGLVSPLSPSLSPLAILMAVGTSSGIGLFFGVFPAKQAAALEPIVALRRN
ncbi:MAG: ABC transporter permease [Cyanobacteria bacterium P01_G01_bin.49]